MKARPLLGLAHRLIESLVTGRSAYLVLFLVVHATLAFTSAGATVLDAVELLLIGAPYSVLVVRRRLSTGLGVLITICLLAAAGLAAFSLPTGGAAPGYAAWPFGAITFVLLGFALVGRYLRAWLVLLGVAGIAVGWSLATGQGPMPGVALVDRHFATLLVGTLFAISYRRSNTAFAAHKAAERRVRAAEQAAEARAAARRSAAESVLEQAGPMLRAIAEGRPLIPAERQELLVLEGTLRDQIRAPWLAEGPLRDSIAAARRRGVNVLLLDESHSAGNPGLRDRAAAWLAEQVDAVHGERFVGRVRGDDEELKVSAVAGGLAEWASFPARADEQARP
jgi:hypothetical protein